MLMLCKRTGVIGLMVNWGQEYSCFCHDTLRKNRSWRAGTHGHKESGDACLEAGYKYGWNYGNGEIAKLFTPVIMENV